MALRIAGPYIAAVSIKGAGEGLLRSNQVDVPLQGRNNTSRILYFLTGAVNPDAIEDIIIQLAEQCSMVPEDFEAVEA